MIDYLDFFLPTLIKDFRILPQNDFLQKNIVRRKCKYIINDLMDTYIMYWQSHIFVNVL